MSAGMQEGRESVGLSSRCDRSGATAPPILFQLSWLSVVDRYRLSFP